MTQSLLDHLSQYGDSPALHVGGQTLSYRRLGERTETVRRELGESRKLVLISSDGMADSLITYVAAIQGGHAVMLGSPEQLPHLQRTYNPDVICSMVSGRWRVQRQRDRSAHCLHPDLALLLSTSGSTGAAKTVRLSYANLQSNAKAIADYLSIDTDDCAALTLPMHYCYGLSVVNSHLVTGAAVMLTDNSVVDPCFWDEFRAAGATSFAGVPYTFDLLDQVNFDQLELPSLRYVTQAGGRLAPDKVQRYAELATRRGWEFYVMYGQTEATARMAYLPPHMATSYPGSIGTPVPGGSFELRACDDLEEGQGELIYRGDNVMMGYAEGPHDLGRAAELDELVTGDIARMNDAGLLEVVGRRSRFLKLFGLRLDLDQVERVLRRERVDAVCTGNDTALVVATEDACRSVCLAQLVRQHFGLPPSAVRVVSYAQVPRFETGKPDYVTIERDGRNTHVCALADRLAAASGPGPKPGGVANILAAALNQAEVRPDDSFVSLGGDSMSYVEVAAALEQAVGTLPSNWHLLPVYELEASKKRPSRLRPVETNVLLRALAIVLVVGTHVTVFDLKGGAHLLLVIAGWNFARFCLQPQATNRQALGRIGRIVVPCVAWIGLQAAITPQYTWANAMLINNYVDNGWWSYWFVETLVQILVVLAVLFAIPAVRRLEQRYQFLLPAALLVGALLARFHLDDTGSPAERIYTTHIIFWFFVLGWMASRASNAWQKLTVAAAAVALVPTYFFESSRDVLVAGGLLVLLFIPYVPMPRVVARLIDPLASASLFIYLTHYLVFPELWPLVPKWANVILCLVVGLASWWAVGKAELHYIRLRTAISNGSRFGAINAQGERPKNGHRHSAGDQGHLVVSRNFVRHDPVRSGHGR